MKKVKRTMPIKKPAYEDDFDSEELSEPETMISKPKMKLKSTVSKAKKGSVKRPMTTGHQRSQSALGTKSAREMWLAAVKTRSTGSPRDGTMSGLKKGVKDNWAFMSSSNYMRQLAGVKGHKGSDDLALKQTARTPNYKSPEEYYDDIIQLKKTIQASNQDISNMRSKLRRTEEDNLKKEKQIEQLLDPTKSEELRRTLTDRKADSGAVIHSLKQKVLKLEIQVRDKEAANAKILSDLKTTKIDEMKTQMEVLYREIVRLQHTKDASVHDTPKNVISKDAGSKVKALNETVLRLNDQNQRLQQDNKKLREDLQKAVEDAAPLDTAKNQNLQNLGKNELISIVRRLNRRVEKAEQKAETDSISVLSADIHHTDSSSKIVLEGPVENRLDQLDRRETELLQETDKLRAVIKRLKEDRTFYRQSAEEKDIEIKVLKNSLEGLPPTSARSTKDRRDTTPRKASTRPPSARSDTARAKRRESSSTDDERRRAVDKFKKNRAAKNIQRHWREHQDRVQIDEETSTQNVKIERFSANRAAKRIQKGWLNLQSNRDHDATASIQAAFRGHKSRRDRLHEWEDEGSLTVSDVTDDEYHSAVDLIQSSLTGHAARRKLLTNKRESVTTDDDDDIVRRKPPRHSVSELSRPTSRQSLTPRQQRRSVVQQQDIDDDDFFG